MENGKELLHPCLRFFSDGGLHFGPAYLCSRTRKSALCPENVALSFSRAPTRLALYRLYPRPG